MAFITLNRINDNGLVYVSTDHIVEVRNINHNTAGEVARLVTTASLESGAYHRILVTQKADEVMSLITSAVE